MTQPSKAQRAKYPVNEPTTRKKVDRKRCKYENRSTKVGRRTSVKTEDCEDSLIPPGKATPERSKSLGASGDAWRPRSIRVKKLLLVLAWYQVLRGPVKPLQHDTLSHLYNKGYFIDLHEDSEAEEVSEDSVSSPPVGIPTCGTNHDGCTTLNGSNGEFTDKNCVRVECLCSYCWHDWGDTLYLHGLLQTGALMVNHLFCSICKETDGFETDELQVGDVTFSTHLAPLGWLDRSTFLQEYYTHVKKAPCVMEYVPYRHVSLDPGEDFLDDACTRMFLRFKYQDTYGALVDANDAEAGEWLANDMFEEQHEVESELNGNNGEVTGDDDMPGFITNAARHNKPVNGGRKNENDMNAKQRVAQKPKAVEPEVVVVEEPPAPKVLHLVFQPFVNYCVYQKELFTRQGPHAVGATGTILPIIDHDVVVPNTVDKGYGYVLTQEGKGSTSVAVASVTTKELFLPVSNVPLTGFLIHPFLSQLKTEFPSATKVVAHARTAAMALCQKHYPTVPSSLMEFTISYFFAEKERFVVDIERLNTPEGVFEAEAYQRLCVTTDYSLPWRSYGTDAVAPFSWECRKDVSMLHERCKGVYIAHGEYDSIGHRQESDYYQFTTLHNPFPRFYHTHMFQFVGDDNKRFVAYDPNGHNANLALKRIFGANDWNDMYMYYQYNLTDAYMYDSTWEDQKVLDILKVNMSNSWFVVGKGHNVHHVVRRPEGDRVLSEQAAGFYNDVGLRTRQLTGYFGPVDMGELYTKVQGAVKDGRIKLISLCDQSVLDMFVDTASNVKDWAYSKCAIGYYRLLDVWNQREYNVEEIQHHKKALRRAWFKGIQLNEEKDCLVKKIILNVKKEWAKPGKVGRLFASYNVGGIYAPELPEFVKACIHGAHFFKGPMCDLTIYIMSKSKDDEINQVFQHALEFRENKNHIFYIVYSDDSCMIGNVHGEAIMANMDISSCDASNRYPIFISLYRLLARFSPERASALLEQCTKNMLLVNPSNPEEVMEICFHSCMEGSGTVLTTVLNHSVSYDIGVAIHTCLNQGIEFEHAVKLGALMVGHKLTIDRCEVPEKLQFLKRSPLMTTDGHPHMCINYGTIFRGLGCVEGDLTALQLGVSAAIFNAMSWKEKTDRFCAVVIQGLVHEPSSTIMDALRQRFVTTPLTVGAGCNTLDYYYQFVPRNHGSNLRIDDETLCKRYNLEPYELGILAEQIMHVGVGMTCPSSAVRKFFGADYSL